MASTVARSHLSERSMTHVRRQPLGSARLCDDVPSTWLDENLAVLCDPVRLATANFLWSPNFVWLAGSARTGHCCNSSFRVLSCRDTAKTMSKNHPK